MERLTKQEDSGDVEGPRNDHGKHPAEKGSTAFQQHAAHRQAHPGFAAQKLRTKGQGDGSQQRQSMQLLCQLPAVSHLQSCVCNVKLSPGMDAKADASLVPQM